MPAARRRPVRLIGLGAVLAAAGGLFLWLRPRPLPVAPPLDARLVTLDSVIVRAEEMPRLTSLIITQHGRTVLERYYRGMTADCAVNLKSVSKTLLSLLVGIAIRDGHLRGTDQPLAELLAPPLAPPLADGKRAITLAHLLTMTAGLEGTSFGEYGEWVSSRNWVRNALERPLVCPPGSCWEYSTGNTHLLSAALTRATGRSTLAYARAALFDPLGIPLPAWDRDPQGIYLGGNNMRLRPRDLAAIGQLYLDGGRAAGRQIVPEEWIRASWQPQVTSPWNGYDYGYLWWSRELAGERVHFAWGYGGQFLFVVPGLDATIVATSSLDGRERGQNREVHRLVGRYVIPVLRQQPVGGCDERSAECGVAAASPRGEAGAAADPRPAVADQAAPR
jgi:CubicO group peptidase (beta-lactamase class C family)